MHPDGTSHHVSRSCHHSPAPNSEHASTLRSLPIYSWYSLVIIYKYPYNSVGILGICRSFPEQSTNKRGKSLPRSTSIDGLSLETDIERGWSLTNTWEYLIIIGISPIISIGRS